MAVSGVWLLAGCQGRPAAETKRMAPDQVMQQAMTPELAQATLLLGNERYVTGQMLHRDWSELRSATAAAQHPYAVVLSCVDSRTSSEIIFDAGHGELFNIRIAGNVLNDDILGSMEFACLLEGARFIAVIGHTHCGAVEGAIKDVKAGHLTSLLARIKPAVKAAETSTSPSPESLAVRVAEANVRVVMQQIRERSPELRRALDSGRIGLAGGMYDLQTGRVRFFKD
jgi:carbonic anhydrase